MSKRLGETLIERGVLRPEDLKKALDAQVIYGGHLGTCLVELGYVDMQTLGEVLAESFQVDHAHLELLVGISPEVIKLLAPSLAERHRAVPFALDGRTLRVAMVNPQDLLALDELSFACGYKVEPWVAPEVQIVRALELYYKVSRSLRHIALSVDPARRDQQAKKSIAVSIPEPPVPEAPRTSEPPPVATASAEPASPRPAPEARRPTTPQAVPRPATPAPAAAAAATPRPALVVEPMPNVSVPEVPPISGDMPDPLLHADGFVAEIAPSYRGQEPAPGSMFVEWTKVANSGQPPHWTDIFDVDLDNDYFDGREGLFVVWYHGRQPVLSVGQGSIRDNLFHLRQNDEIIEIARENTVHVTWAAVEPGSRTAIERYLIDMLDPRIHMRLPHVEPMEVNLPR